MLPLHLDGASKRALINVGLKKLSSLLAKSESDLSDFERALLQAIRWFSDSRIQATRETELLSLTTSCEAFFTLPGERISLSLAEGIAFAMTAGVENRRQLRKRIRYLYSLRGRVTHGGRQDVLKSDLDELRWWAMNLILVMIDELTRFSSRRQLLDWVDDQRLS